MATARTNLGLGTAATTDASAYQASDPELSALAGLTLARQGISSRAAARRAFTTTAAGKRYSTTQTPMRNVQRSELERPILRNLPASLFPTAKLRNAANNIRFTMYGNRSGIARFVGTSMGIGRISFWRVNHRTSADIYNSANDINWTRSSAGNWKATTTGGANSGHGVAGSLAM